ncbi:MAG: ankyrin repeat domain-containing protein [Rickettsiaceae bacterium H1]|nr:ankyrin repeat domain-containing protein [Rickettsiaceae bacterium H1]
MQQVKQLEIDKAKLLKAIMEGMVEEVKSLLEFLPVVGKKKVKTLPNEYAVKIEAALLQKYKEILQKCELDSVRDLSEKTFLLFNVFDLDDADKLFGGIMEVFSDFLIARIKENDYDGLLQLLDANKGIAIRFIKLKREKNGECYDNRFERQMAMLLLTSVIRKLNEIEVDRKTLELLLTTTQDILFETAEYRGVFCEKNFSGKNILHVAAEEGYTQIFSFLFGDELPRNLLNFVKRELMFAFGNTKLALKRNKLKAANIKDVLEEKTQYGDKTPIIIAIENDCVEIVGEILNFNNLGSDECVLFECLSTAMKAHKENSINFLLKKYLDVNSNVDMDKADFDQKLFTVAVREGNVRLAEIFLDRDVQVHSYGCLIGDIFPLGFASEQGNLPMVKLLLKKRYFSNYATGYALADAIKKKNMNVVIELLLHIGFNQGLTNAKNQLKKGIELKSEKEEVIRCLKAQMKMLREEELTLGVCSVILDACKNSKDKELLLENKIKKLPLPQKLKDKLTWYEANEPIYTRETMVKPNEKLKMFQELVEVSTELTKPEVMSYGDWMTVTFTAEIER